MNWEYKETVCFADLGLKLHQYILQCVCVGGGERESIYEILLPWSVCKGEERMSREILIWKQLKMIYETF